MLSISHLQFTEPWKAQNIFFLNISKFPLNTEFENSLEVSFVRMFRENVMIVFVVPSPISLLMSPVCVLMYLC